MKTVKWLVSIGVTFALFATVVKGFTINGSYDPSFGSAIATQVLGTADAGGLKNTVGDVGGANGSELDAAYGYVSNGVLYLFFAGNLDTGADPVNLCTNGCNTYDKLSVFFMADSGAGGDNTLGTNYSSNADSGGINRMGVGGNGSDSGSAGLTFDSGFNANYWIGVPVGGNTNVGVYVNYEVICSGCNGAYVGNAAPTNTITDNSNGGNDPSGLAAGIQVALDNSNTNGVWGDSSGCYMYQFGGSTNNPLAVTHGVEMAIPLSDIGSPLSSVSICAFITKNDFSTIYNNVLGPVWDGTTNYCIANLSADGDSSEVSFPSLPGAPHYFTIPVPSCNSIQANPTSVTYTPSVATGTVSVTTGAGCGWTASVNTNWVTILSGGSGSGGSVTLTYAVATNTAIRARTADLYLVGTSVPVTQTVSILQTGVTLPPLGAILVDGTADPGYGCPLTVQTMGTGYGKSTTTNIGTAGGSELDAAYGLVQNNTLFLLFAGKLESNGNHLHMFFMTQPGGTNTLLSVEPLIGGTNGSAATILRDMAGTTNAGSGPGLTFDAGFAPNYWMNVNISNPYHLYLDYAQLWPGGTNAAGVATNGYFVGSSTTLTNGTLVPGVDNFGAGNPFGIQVTVNNSSSTNGVDGNSCVSNANPSAVCYTNLNVNCAVLVTNGVELAIPLAALGNPTGPIGVFAFIGGGSGPYMSNQILPPINPTAANTWTCTNNLAGGGTAMSYVNFGTLPGGPHYFYVGPEMRVTGVSRAVSAGTTNVNVTVLPENNTNLLYQLQRTFAPLTTNSTWANVGPVTNGGPAAITLTDPHATNRVGTVQGILYRVLQEPNCTPGEF
jgi:hypothetical protein